MGHTKPIETANAAYVLSLENHNKPDYTGLRNTDFDVLVLEQGMNFSEKDLARFRKLNELTHKPIVLLDPSFKEDVIAEVERGELMVIHGFVIFGASVALWKWMKRKMPRRSFLATAAAGAGLMFFGQRKIAGSEYDTGLVFSDSPSAKLGFPGEIELTEEQRLYLAKQEKDFPIVVDARNAIIAEKLESVLSKLFREELGRKPRFAIQIGWGHAGLIQQLQNPIKRRETILKYQERINHAFKSSHLKSSYRLEWDERSARFKVKQIDTPIQKVSNVQVPVTKERKLARRTLILPFRRPRRHT